MILILEKEKVQNPQYFQCHIKIRVKKTRKGEGHNDVLTQMQPMTTNMRKYTMEYFIYFMISVQRHEDQLVVCETGFNITVMTRPQSPQILASHYITRGGFPRANKSYISR